MTEPTKTKSSHRPDWVTMGLIASVLCLLFAIAVPSLHLLEKPRGPTPEFIQCQSNLRDIALGIMLYQVDFDNQLPSSLSLLVENEFIPHEYLTCPTVPNGYKVVSYVYRGSDIADYMNSPPEMILIYCKHIHENGLRTVCFFDGHAESATEKEFRQHILRDNKLRRELGLPEKAMGW